MRSLGYFIATFAAALVLGIGSAWYMIERGSFLTTAKVGPWESWLNEGNPNADPYTKAHLARSGRLPLTTTVARYFVARTDNAGRSLRSSCVYSIVGSPLNARWWSLAVYDGTEVVATSKVSTGKPGHTTPSGIFSVLEKKTTGWAHRASQAA